MDHDRSSKPELEPGERLLQDFSPSSKEAWHQEVVKLLKGAPFEKKMLTQTLEDLTLEPIYTQDDLEGLTAPRTMPGESPFLRGPSALGNKVEPWWVAQELPFPTYEEFNQALRYDLQRGQTAVNLVLDLATQAGNDPDQAEPGEVGAGGTSIASVIGMSRALEGIDLEATPVLIQAGSAALPVAALLVALMRRQGKDPGRLRGAIGMDPLTGLVELGSIPICLNCAYDELACLTGWAAEHAPGVMTVAAYGFPYHEAGAGAVQELGFTLAAAAEHLRRLEERGIAPETAAPRIFFGLSAGTHFFMEMAKLRAARLVWARLAQACDLPPAAGRMFLHVRTSRYSQSALDVQTNILRGSTQAFAAILGGCDSLQVEPFDRPRGLPDELSRRLARNTQIILREEAHLDAVLDPAGGSWFVERLTHDLARKAWELFQQVESRGGLAKALQDGWPQAQVEATAAAREKGLAGRRQVMVGVNQYPNSMESPRTSRLPDYQAIHAARSQRLQQLRTSAEHVENVAVLETLGRILDSKPEDLFESVVQAALQGATIGEFTRALRHGKHDIPEVTPLRARRGSEPFERLRKAVAEWQRGRRGEGTDAGKVPPGAAGGPTPSAAPDVFLANLGPLARYMPRLDFTRSFFQVAGFVVASDQWFENADQAYQAASESRAAIVVLVSTDDQYPEFVPGLARRLKKLDAPPRVILAGLPAEQEECFRQAGVDEFIHIRSDVLAVLEGLARDLGVQS